MFAPIGTARDQVRCNATRCTTPVAPGRPFCTRHERVVPYRIMKELRAATPGMLRYVVALQEAIEAITIAEEEAREARTGSPQRDAAPGLEDAERSARSVGEGVRPAEEGRTP